MMPTPAPQIPIDLREPAPYPQLTYEQHDNLGGWRKLGAVLLLGLLVVLLLNGLALAYLQTGTANADIYLGHVKWHLLESLSAPVDWLILGDSSGNQGFDPRVLQSEHGLSSVNLATFANWGAVDDAWMLELYVQRFGAPRAVVLIFVYDLYERSFNPNLLAQIPIKFSYWRDYSFSLHLSWPEELHDLLTRYVPLYSQHRSIAGIIEDILRPEPKQWPEFIDGFMIQRNASPPTVEADRLEHLDKLAKASPFIVSNVNKEALAYIITLAESQGFTVYLKDSPIDEVLYNDPVFQAHYQQIQAWLRSFEAESRAFVYLDEPSLFQPNMLQNADHVTVEGATIFTRQVAELILAQQKD